MVATAAALGLHVEGLQFSYGNHAVLCGVDLAQLPAGQITAVIGPNATGKTTFFKCLAGLLPGKGRVILNGQDLSLLQHAARTEQVVYLPQENQSAAVLTVFEAVLLARQQAATWRVTDADLASVAAVLDDLQISDLGSRYLNELSGGQKQLVSIAQALVRQPAVLLLDEPTSSLDLQRQLEVLSLLRRVTVKRNIITLIAVHDLNLAARYASRVIVLQGGTTFAAGPPAEVLTAAMIRRVYGVEARVSLDDQGFAQVIALRSVRDID